MLKKFQNSAQEDKEKKDTKERTKYEYLEYSNQLQKQVIDTRPFSVRQQLKTFENCRKQKFRFQSPNNSKKINKHKLTLRDTLRVSGCLFFN